MNQYKSLIKFLHQLNREEAKFNFWHIEYNRIDGEPDGTFKITITGNEKR